MRTGVSVSRHFMPPLGENLLLALAGLLLFTSYSFPQYVSVFKNLPVRPYVFPLVSNE